MTAIENTNFALWAEWFFFVLFCFVKPGRTGSNGQALKQSSTVSSFVTAMKYDYMFRLKLTVVISIPDIFPVPNTLDVTHLKYPHPPCKNFEFFSQRHHWFLCDLLMLPSHPSKTRKFLPTVESKRTDPHTVEPHSPSVFVPLLITEKETSSGDGNLASSRSASVPSLVGGENGVGHASMSLRSPLCAP